MKRLLIAILILLLASPAMAEEPFQLAGMLQGVVAGSGGGAACSQTLRDSEATNDSTAAVAIGCRAIKMVASESFSLKILKITVHRDIGDTAQVVTAHIYKGNSGPDSSATATSTNTIPLSDITTNVAGEVLEYNFSGVSIANAEIYWIVLQNNDATALLRIHRSEDVSFGSNTNYTSADCSDWSVALDNDRAVFEAYSCD